MNDKYFIDTNILVYSFDKSSKAKQDKAQKLISGALANNAGIISYQVLQEFLNLSTKKFVKPFSLKEIRKYLDEVLVPLCAVHSSAGLYFKAIRIQEESHYSFYDSLIIAGAVEAGCRILYSEDFQHQQKLSGLEIINPFIG